MSSSRNSNRANPTSSSPNNNNNKSSRSSTRNNKATAPYQSPYRSKPPPLPLSITLRNQIVSSTKNKSEKGGISSPQPYGTLLPRIVPTILEVVVEPPPPPPPDQLPPSQQRDGDLLDLTTTSSSNDNGNDEILSRREPRIIYKNEHEASLNPQWYHINERIEKQLASSPSDDVSPDTEEMYRSTTARVVVRRTDVDDDHHPTKNPPPLDDDDDCIVLASIPLHPYLLRRLPLSPPSPPDDQSPFHDPLTAPGGDVAGSVPAALPPNVMLVEYADGSTRVLPGLYRLLLSRKVISEEGRAAEELREDIMEEERRTIRFSDDVFDVLGEEEGEGGEGGVEMGGGGGGSDDRGEDNFSDVFDLLGDNNNTGGGGGGGGGVVRREESMHEEERKDKTRQQEMMMLSSNNEERLMMMTDDEIVNGVSSSNEISDAEKATRIDKEAVASLKDELSRLETMLCEEEMALENDQNLLKMEMDRLRSLTNDTQELERKKDLIQTKIESELEHLEDSTFLLEARQIKLLRDLTAIYPIRSLANSGNNNNNNNNSYAIRNIELPSDMNSPDDQISSGLGYLTHLVFMTSKYLSIPLRYNLICNGSRSAVQDTTNVYPLFKLNMEREMFDRGVLLLEKDVECLLKKRGVKFKKKVHILAKLQKLYLEVGVYGGGATNTKAE